MIAVLTAGLLSVTLFAMNRSLQNAISPLFAAGRVQPTAAAGSPSPLTPATPIVLATATTVPPAEPLVGVNFAAPDTGSGLSPNPAPNPAPAPAHAPQAPVHKPAPRVLAAAISVPKAGALVAPVAEVPRPPVAPVKAAVALAAALHSPTQTAFLDMPAVAPLSTPAVAAIVLPVPHVITTMPMPTPTATHHHHDGAQESVGTRSGGHNGRSPDRGDSRDS
ncbi:MAG TPA: hypothetical protein VFW71_09645 [Actinomycetota bacterium]|nr:hypothetical protein [Actinomycetota bacterium]